MAMVNPVIPPPVFNPQVKDSRWLTLEVCREYTRNKCTRSDTECKFAHPPPHVEVQNGRVTCCFDSIKGKCQRKDPPCKYLHPPQHLKEQLLQNGRNNLIIRQLQMQALATGLQPMAPMYQVVSYGEPSSQGAPGGRPSPPAMPSAYPAANVLSASPAQMAGAVQYQNLMAHPNAFVMQNAQAAGFNPYMQSLGSMAGILPAGASLDGSGATVPVSGAAGGINNHLSQAGMMTQGGLGPQHKLSRVDRLEPSTSSPSSLSNGSESSAWIPGGSPVSDTLAPTTQCSPLYFQSMSTAGMPGMLPMVKRPAVADSKSGVPIGYTTQQNAGTSSYQHAALAAMQLQQQQPFVPVTIAGHPPGMPRF